MKTKTKRVWSIEWMRGRRGDMILGTFSSKAKALEAIDFWAEDGELVPLDLGEKLPYDRKPCVVNVARPGKHPAMLFIHPVNLNNGAAIARMKYHK